MTPFVWDICFDILEKTAEGEQQSSNWKRRAPLAAAATLVAAPALAAGGYVVHKKYAPLSKIKNVIARVKKPMRTAAAGDLDRVGRVEFTKQYQKMKEHSRMLDEKIKELETQIPSRRDSEKVTEEIKRMQDKSLEDLEKARGVVDEDAEIAQKVMSYLGGAKPPGTTKPNIVGGSRPVDLTNKEDVKNALKEKGHVWDFDEGGTDELSELDRRLEGLNTRVRNVLGVPKINVKKPPKGNN